MRHAATLFALCLQLSQLLGQEYVEVFAEGQKLYTQGSYYEAYLRFNASYILADIARNNTYRERSSEARDRSARSILRQQQVADSLLLATRKLTDAFYFYQGRLALAYKNNRFGFIDRQGRVAIPYLYASATSFDPQSGYARVRRPSNPGDDKGEYYWLAPDGTEYPGTLRSAELPAIQPVPYETDDSAAFVAPDLSAYRKSGNAGYVRDFNEGIDLYAAGKYYEAFLRFNAAAVLARQAPQGTVLAAQASQLKDSAIVTLLRLFGEAEQALRIATSIREAFFFYDSKFALAYNDQRFYFIDPAGNPVTKLGRWAQAQQFDGLGHAKVISPIDSQTYLLDTLGHTYRAAFSLAELTPETQALDLSDMGLTAVPGEICAYTRLEILMVNNNQLDSLPVDLGRLLNLRKLYAHSNRLHRLPGGLRELSELIKLVLQGNLLSSLPEEIGALSQLQELDLSDNQLNILPSEIGALSQLQWLDLSGNQLNILPPELWVLSQLRGLDLSRNRFSSLTPQIGALSQLRGLDLSRNRFSSLTPQIGALSQLQRLDLSGNQFSILPPEIGALSQLKELDLSGNQFSNLPPEIGALGQLQELDLSFNGLKVLPPEIGALSQLRRLSLSSNQLISLPPELWVLSQLKELGLSSNQLTRLPPEIGALGQLRQLELSRNQLISLPPELWVLSQLKELGLSSNQLTRLPPEIGALGQLRQLELSRNQLISLPPEIGALGQLQELDVSGNDSLGMISLITALKPIDKNLFIVSSHSYSFNSDHHLVVIFDAKLSNLPPEIGALSQLSYLNMSGNQLISLPPEIGTLSQLSYLNMSGNQLISLPPEIGALS